MSFSLLSIRLVAMPLYKPELFSAAFEEKGYSYLFAENHYQQEIISLVSILFLFDTCIYPSCILGYVLRAGLSCDQTGNLSCIYYPFKNKQTSISN